MQAPTKQLERSNKTELHLQEILQERRNPTKPRNQIQIFRPTNFPAIQMARISSHTVDFRLIITLLLSLQGSALAASSSLSSSMVSSLSLAGYAQFAAALVDYVSEFASGGSALTYFAPPDSSLNGIHLTANFVRYHVVSGGAHTYRTLVWFEPGMHLSTLLDNSTLLVTESMGDQQKFSVNNVLIDMADIYFDGNSSVQGVMGPLVHGKPDFEKQDAHWSAMCQSRGTKCPFSPVSHGPHKLGLLRHKKHHTSNQDKQQHHASDESSDAGRLM